jgi:signal peptidase I
MSKEIVKNKSALREYAEAILIALVLALFIRTFIVQAFKIPSGSMIQTLLVGDHILVNKFIFGPRVDIGSIVNFRLFPFRKPERLDVIVFLEPREREKDFIKRVIGLPGETLQVINRQVYINGAPLDESAYVYFEGPRSNPELDDYGPIQIPLDSYFVMGDNRENSADSRVWGPLPFSLVKGEAFMIYWSWNGPKTRVRWGRIGDIIH